MQHSPITPAPVHVEMHEGPPFALRDGLRVVSDEGAEVVSVALLAAARIGRGCGFPVAVVTDDDGRGDAVVLRLVATPSAVGLPDDLAPELAAEGYRVEITDRRATITATTAAGLIRGALTVQQTAVRIDDGGWALRPCVVVDHPRFAWRGLSLDVARRFIGVHDVKTVLNLMTVYKLNVLHLHLTDDQGWRLQLASRPELTRASGGTAVEGGPAGFYTAADYAEIVGYAAARHIAVVPEVDVPGHVNAALHAYGDLTPTGEAPPEYTGIDVGFSRLHADLPATAPFLGDVFGELATMTPGHHVHLGGDEVTSMDPDEYALLVRTAARHLAAAGKAVVGWQEVASVLPEADQGPDAPAVVIQYWDERTGAQEVVDAAARGARVLLSPASRVYLDMRYDEHTPVGLEWAGHVEVRDSYAWEPLEVLPLDAAQIIGVEAALWTETVQTADQMFLLLLPRLVAVAEVAWSAAGRRDWDDFAARLPGQRASWDEAGLTWYPSPQIAW
ncbi:MAG: family 20 glycosylhydrolase [Cellulomonadaceae bacterium]|nr:family 20 glycosylhydrolase [Cellulomonadaceae bacterium]